jgi:hypothetical protein
LDEIFRAEFLYCTPELRQCDLACLTRLNQTLSKALAIFTDLNMVRQRDAVLELLPDELQQ